MTELIRKMKHTEWIDSFAEYEKTEDEQVISKEIHPARKSLSMGEVVRAVSEATHHEAVLVTDVGQNQMMSARYFKYSKNAASLLPADWEQWASVFLQHRGYFRLPGSYCMRIYG